MLAFGPAVRVRSPARAELINAWRATAQQNHYYWNSSKLGESAHARGHFHRSGRTYRRTLPPGAAEERADRNHPASAPAIRRDDEPSDHLPALLRLRAPRLLGAALQFPSRRP